MKVRTIFRLVLCLLLMSSYGCRKKDTYVPYYEESFLSVVNIYDVLLNRPINFAHQYLSGDPRTGKLYYVDTSECRGRMQYMYEKSYHYYAYFSNEHDIENKYHLEFIIPCAYNLYTINDTVKYVELVTGGHNMDMAKDSIFYWLEKFTYLGPSQNFKIQNDTAWWSDNYQFSVAWNPIAEYRPESENNPWNHITYSAPPLSNYQVAIQGMQYILDSIPAEHDFIGTISANNDLFESIFVCRAEYDFFDPEEPPRQWTIEICVRANN